MSGWAWFLAGAFTLAAWGLWRGGDAPSQEARGWSPRRVGLGASVTLVAIAGGIFLTSVNSKPPPEQRGIGVWVHGVSALPERGGDVGLSLAANVSVGSCDDDVAVRLTLAPTAEFWIDNARRLADDAEVRIAIPSLGLHDIKVSTSESIGDALIPVVAPESAPAPGPEEDTKLTGDPQEDDDSGFTFLDIVIPEWGRSTRPLTVNFRADWTDSRSRLGGCYVRLPALVGLPTVLSGAAARGRVSPLDDVPHAYGGGNLFMVSSVEAGLRAFYDESLEVTRGVTSLTMKDQTLDQATSLPAPNANYGGKPSWTCHSSIASGDRTVYESEPGTDMGDADVLFNPTGPAAYSSERLAEILDQSTCASYAAIESSGFGTKRDLVLICIGALFSLGIELAMSGARRRRADVGSGGAVGRSKRSLSLHALRIRRRSS